MTIDAYRKMVDYLRTWIPISNERANSVWYEFSSQLDDGEFRKIAENAKNTSQELGEACSDFISQRALIELTPEPGLDPSVEDKAEIEKLYNKIPYTRKLEVVPDEPAKPKEYCCSYGLLIAEKDGRIFAFRCPCDFGAKVGGKITMWTNDPSYKKL